MPWSIIIPIALAALKIVLKLLETPFPGLTPFIEAVLAFLNGGGKIEELHAHCEKLPGFCPSDLKRI